MKIKFGKEVLEVNGWHGGFRYTFKFENGYGASVVRHNFSCGGLDGLWELGVLDSEGNLNYDTQITNDVLGYLSDDNVASILIDIENLNNEKSEYEKLIGENYKYEKIDFDWREDVGLERFWENEDK